MMHEQLYPRRLLIPHTWHRIRPRGRRGEAPFETQGDINTPKNKTLTMTFMMHNALGRSGTQQISRGYASCVKPNADSMVNNSRLPLIGGSRGKAAGSGCSPGGTRSCP